MKKDWEIKKLGDVCQIRPSKNETTKFLKDDDNVSFFPMEDLQIMNYYIEPKQLKKLKEVSGSYTCFANGDVLLAKVTPCFENGKLGIANNLENGVGFGSSEYIVFRPSNILLSEYLYYCLASPNFRENGKKHLLGACGLKRLSKDYVNEYEIPIPPLEEQKRIVKILDEKFAQLESLKANAQTNLQNAKDLFQSQLTKAFSNTTWEKKRLGEVSSQLFAGGDAPKENYSKEKTEKYNIPIYANAVAENGLYGYTDVATVFEPSVTIAARGSGTGYVISRNEPFLPIVRLIVVVPNVQIITQRYLYFALRNIPIDHSGAAIPQLTIPMIRDYEIPLPPLPEQKRIVKELDALSEKVRQLQEIYTKQIANCDELKQAYLQKAFEGEL